MKHSKLKIFLKKHFFKFFSLAVAHSVRILKKCQRSWGMSFSTIAFFKFENRRYKIQKRFQRNKKKTFQGMYCQLNQKNAWLKSLFSPFLIWVVSLLSSPDWISAIALSYKAFQIFLMLKTDGYSVLRSFWSNHWKGPQDLKLYCCRIEVS